MTEWFSILTGILGIALGAGSAILAVFVGRRARSAKLAATEMSLQRLVSENSALQAALRSQEKKSELIYAQDTAAAVSAVVEDKVNRTLARQGVSPEYKIDYLTLGKNIGSIQRFYHALEDVYLHTKVGLYNIAGYARTLASSAHPALLFVDLVNSTSLQPKLGTSGLGAFLEKVRTIVYQEASSRQGSLVSSLGDGFMLVFQSVQEALDAAKAIHRKFAAGIDSIQLSARMAIDLTEKEITKAIENVSRMERATDPNKISLSTQVLSGLGHIPGLESEKKNVLVADRRINFQQLSQVD